MDYNSIKMEALTDEKIMMEVKNGNKDYFNQILDRHYKSILNYAYRISGNKALSEDIAQDTFSKIYFAAKRYKPTAPFKVFLYTVAFRESIKALRKNKKHIALNDMMVLPSTDNPSKNLEDKDTSLLVRNAILKLEPKYRSAIILREYNNLTYEEIAKVLKCSLANTKNYIFRAKEKLRELLIPVLRGAL
ncbi:MAG: hypothetical protein A2Y62_21135 [Candidatus Fischerbacteria bacterium RBG_13_37_8]|uniref:RNA polymerase sigma factor n=1 Tax=Candidatus Fischerbacteria bacterium RBG_13_37_8 TaxID=1817863 RepID=A0A1F5V7U6_9BACT|nr:MAG: hypothetical protein A2Y62_21135 [Candidatus Fischerbacteria bacterium RBG_13_37_8]